MSQSNSRWLHLIVHVEGEVVVGGDRLHVEAGVEAGDGVQEARGVEEGGQQQAGRHVGRHQPAAAAGEAAVVVVDGGTHRLPHGAFY